MVKKTIIVPSGIRYISDWAKRDGGYRLEDYNFPHIVNKQLTGCGFTEYCLRNDLNVILCSPRKILLENKEGQHENEVLYVNNILGRNTTSTESYDSEPMQRVSKVTKMQLENLELEPEDEENIKARVRLMRVAIEDYVSTNKKQGKPLKILVTYDSFRHVKSALSSMHIFDSFFVVVDEFQSIFVDSRFKSTTELEFSDQLSGVDKVCYVSATPMIDKYLNQLENFKDLPYYEFDWSTEDQNRIITPRLEVKATKSVMSEAGKIIADYKSGKFLVHAERDSSNNITNVVSKEAVMYFNSVKHICSLISKFGLTQDECNVLCARSPENEEKVRKAFGVGKKDFQGVGIVPKRGESHKMFTFCTRTVYLGADFYSTNARTFIFSDANINSLSVDISLDLPQILGRQRLDENPWKNSASFFFRPLLDKNEIPEEAFEAMIEKKVNATNSILTTVDNIPSGAGKDEIIDTLDIQAKLLNYKNNYVAVNHHSGSSPKPTFNSLVMISERRAFDIQQVDYKDRFKVFCALESINKDSCEVSTDVITEALARFDSLPNFSEKMKFLCTDDEYSEDIRLKVMRSVPDSFDCYYRILGPETIKRYSFRKYEIETEYKRILNNSDTGELVKSVVMKTFKVGTAYPKPYVKSELKRIYRACNYTATAKATDLANFFEIKDYRKRDESGSLGASLVKILSVK